jgi:hypothetical protein
VLLLKRVEHGFEPVRIHRTGRCLQDWKVMLEAEKHWLRVYESAIEQAKQLAREQEEAEREEREMEELLRAEAEEAEKERKKARFMGSFKKLQLE